MGKRFILRVFVLPIMIAFITTCIAMLADDNLDSQAAINDPTIREVISTSLIFFLGFYIFIIVSVLPINIYFSKIIRNKFISFILFNVVGFILVRFTIGTWIFSSVDYISIYLIFPLFSILSLIRIFDYNVDYIEKG